MRRTMLAFGLCLTLARCGAVVDGKLADQEVARFHAGLDAAKFGELYAAGGDELKTAASEADWVKLLGAVHRKLGTVQSTERTGMNSFAGTGGSSVTLVYKTRFQNGAAIETFVYRGADHGLKLVGYNINSNALVTG